MDINCLSVWRIDPNDPKPSDFGALIATELEPGAVKLCQKWVDFLWFRPPDRPDTRVHSFEATGARAGRAQDIKTALWSIAQGIDIATYSERIARYVSESVWSSRYVLLIIGFGSGNRRFVALVMTQSAKDETFEITKEKLVSELENIFKKTVDKGLIYPNYVVYRGIEEPDRAKVYQDSPAQYILEKLGLVPVMTANEVAAMVVRQMQSEGVSPTSLNILAEDVVKRAAVTKQADPERVASDGHDASVSISLDSGIRLQTTVQAIRERVIAVEGVPGQYRVVIRTGSVEVRVGGQHVQFGDLIRQGN